MAYYNIAQKFLTTDVTVPINTTYIEGTHFTSNVIDCSLARLGSLILQVKGGNAGCSATVTFRFVTSYDGINWDTDYYIEQSITMSGTSQRQKTLNVNLPVGYIKLYSIQNPETTAGYTAICNAILFVKEEPHK